MGTNQVWDTISCSNTSDDGLIVRQGGSPAPFIGLIHKLLRMSLQAKKSPGGWQQKEHFWPESFPQLGANTKPPPLSFYLKQLKAIVCSLLVTNSHGNYLHKPGGPIEKSSALKCSVCFRCSLSSQGIYRAQTARCCSPAVVTLGARENLERAFSSTRTEVARNPLAVLFPEPK